MAYGEIIRKLRIQKGMNQSELAERIGMKVSTVRMWEIEKSTPPLKQLIALSDEFNVSIDFLVGQRNVSDVPPVSEEELKIPALSRGDYRKFILELNKLLQEKNANHQAVLRYLRKSIDHLHAIYLCNGLPRYLTVGNDAEDELIDELGSKRNTMAEWYKKDIKAINKNIIDPIRDEFHDALTDQYAEHGFDINRYINWRDSKKGGDI